MAEPKSCFIQVFIAVRSIVILIRAFNVLAIGWFTRIFPLDGQHELPKRLASLFPTKSDTKHGSNSVLTLPRPRKTFHPFLATILPSARLSRWMIFNSPLRGQTACTTGFLVHSSPPVVLFLPLFISVFSPPLSR